MGECWATTQARGDTDGLWIGRPGEGSSWGTFIPHAARFDTNRQRKF